METLPVIKDIDELQRFAQLMVSSGYFSEVKDVAQACVKIMAGRELGLPEIAAMRGIDIVKGQITIRAHLMGGMIKRSGRYNYRVNESSNTRCEIEYFEKHQPLGISEFTIDDAKAAGLGGDAWRKYTKAMLYNRAMSQGARMFCPDIFLGAIYDEGEIEIDEEPVRPGIQVARKISEVPEGGFMDKQPVQRVDQALPNPAQRIAGPTQSAGPTKADEPASDKQIAYLTSLMAQRGIMPGHAHKLLMFSYGEALPHKDSVSRHIEEMLEVSDVLPEYWLFTYIRMLRTEAGMDAQRVSAYIKHSFGKKDPRDLTNEERTQLFAWIMIQGDEEDMDNSQLEDGDWTCLFNNLCEYTGHDAGDVEGWLLAGFGKGKAREIADLPKGTFAKVAKMSTVDVKDDIDMHLAIQKNLKPETKD